MKNSLRIYGCAILLAGLLTAVLPVPAQEGLERKKAELTKEMTDLLGIYGIEKPAKAAAAYLRHLMEGKKEKAYGVFETKETVKRFLDRSEDMKYLRAHVADIPTIDFVG